MSKSRKRLSLSRVHVICSLNISKGKRSLRDRPQTNDHSSRAEAVRSTNVVCAAFPFKVDTHTNKTYFPGNNLQTADELVRAAIENDHCNKDFRIVHETYVESVMWNYNAMMASTINHGDDNQIKCVCAGDGTLRTWWANHGR